MAALSMGELEITVTLPLTRGSTTKLFPVMVETWATNSRKSAFLRFTVHVSSAEAKGKRQTRKVAAIRVVLIFIFINVRKLKVNASYEKVNYLGTGIVRKNRLSPRWTSILTLDDAMTWSIIAESFATAPTGRPLTERTTSPGCKPA